MLWAGGSLVLFWHELPLGEKKEQVFERKNQSQREDEAFLNRPE
jgi:hypothetical protein